MNVLDMRYVNDNLPVNGRRKQFEAWRFKGIQYFDSFLLIREVYSLFGRNKEKVEANTRMECVHPINFRKCDCNKSNYQVLTLSGGSPVNEIRCRFSFAFEMQTFAVHRKHVVYIVAMNDWRRWQQSGKCVRWVCTVVQCTEHRAHNSGHVCILFIMYAKCIHEKSLSLKYATRCKLHWANTRPTPKYIVELI